jgi:hypothetical protein
VYFLKVVNGQETALSAHHYPHLTFLQLLFLPHFPCIIASDASSQLVDEQWFKKEGHVTLIRTEENSDISDNIAFPLSESVTYVFVIH